MEAEADFRHRKASCLLGRRWWTRHSALVLQPELISHFSSNGGERKEGERGLSLARDDPTSPFCKFYRRHFGGLSQVFRDGRNPLLSVSAWPKHRPGDGFAYRPCSCLRYRIVALDNSSQRGSHLHHLEVR